MVIIHRFKNPNKSLAGIFKILTSTHSIMKILKTARGREKKKLIVFKEAPIRLTGDVATPIKAMKQ